MRTFAFILLTGILLSLCVAISHGAVRTNLVTPGSDEDQSTVEFYLVIEHKFTMTKKVGEKTLPVLVMPNGTLSYRTASCDDFIRIDEDDSDEIIFADGRYKLVNAINGSIPGPPIVVYEGQQVVVHVTNKLTNEGTTIHWHGVKQRNSPWMDGVGAVSQCSINPHETFTYRFIADDPGSHWYHAHVGTQRTEGIYGAFTVLEKKVDEIERRGSDKLPVFGSDHHMIVQDWMKESSVYVASLLKFDDVSFATGFDNPHCFNSSKQVDGSDAGVLPFEAGIINGKGSLHITQPGNNINEGLPTETFFVENPTPNGVAMRFRLVNAAMHFAFRVSIDHHPLHIIATDGNHVNTMTVESVIIYGGERYDFWINATDPLGTGVYCVRFETLEREKNGKRIKPGKMHALLRYQNVKPDKTNKICLESRNKCTAEKPCLVLNCPYRFYPVEENTLCIPLTDLRSPLMEPTHNSDPEHFTEMFLNYHFSGFDVLGQWVPTVNGRRHQPFIRPPQVYPQSVDSRHEICKLGETNPDVEECTHMVELPLGNTIQLVLITTISPPANGVLNGNSHPIHIHGHSFQVIKVGWPQYNNMTGKYLHQNSDFECPSGLCHDDTRWRNSSWYNGNIPGIVNQGAPRKDTVLVPAGGYVVVRFKADNPGFWYSHCHIEFHNDEGMGMIFKEGAISDMNAAPPGMQRCGDFSFSEDTFN
ncbi:unnamed protein product, partial [Owenia fusiformis]